MSIQRVGNLEVHYRERGQGTPLVLIPGNWSTSLWWQPVMDLIPEGWRILSADTRGRGHTRGPSVPQDLPTLAEDLRGLLDTLNIPRAHFIGHSLGTAVALQLALSHPERVLSLTLLAPAWVEGMPAAYNRPEHQLALHDNPDYFRMAMRGIAPTAPEDPLWRQLLEEGQLQRREASLAVLQAMVDWVPGERLKALRPLPSLVVSGEKDPLSTVEVGRRCAELLGARHHVIQGVGHSPNIETPRDFAALWQDFMRHGRSPPAPPSDPR